MAIGEEGGSLAVSSVFEGYADYHTVDDTQVLLELWDVTARQGDVERLRPLAYVRTDVFILCFSLVDPDSYERVRTKVFEHIPSFIDQFSYLNSGLQNWPTSSQMPQCSLSERNQTCVRT